MRSIGMWRDMAVRGNGSVDLAHNVIACEKWISYTHVVMFGHQGQTQVRREDNTISLRLYR